ncbi:hypothetical protein V8D89_012866 [Ganoderma adspersum]
MVLPNDTVLPPVQATIAWVLFGLCFALLFYGVMLCQGHAYFWTYQKDPLDLKFTVAAILLANAVNIGLIMHTCYYYAVAAYTAPNAFDRISSSLSLTPVCIFLCILLCEYVYIRRTYLIIPPKCRWVFVPLVVLFVVSAGGFIIALTVEIIKEPVFQRWLEFKWLVSACFACSVLGDLGLACIQSLALHIRRTGVKQTDALLNLIIINAFRSGIVTSVLSILCLLVAVFEGKNVVIIPLGLVLAKIYANVTLVTLNIRRDISGRFAGAPGGSEQFTLSLFRCASALSERDGGNVQVPRYGDRSTLDCET